MAVVNETALQHTDCPLAHACGSFIIHCMAPNTGNTSRQQREAHSTECSGDSNSRPIVSVTYQQKAAMDAIMMLTAAAASKNRRIQGSDPETKTIPTRLSTAAHVNALNVAA